MWNNTRTARQKYQFARKLTFSIQGREKGYVLLVQSIIVQARVRSSGRNGSSKETTISNPIYPHSKQNNSSYRSCADEFFVPPPVAFLDRLTGMLTGENSFVTSTATLINSKSSTYHEEVRSTVHQKENQSSKTATVRGRILFSSNMIGVHAHRLETRGLHTLAQLWKVRNSSRCGEYQRPGLLRPVASAFTSIART